MVSGRAGAGRDADPTYGRRSDDERDAGSGRDETEPPPSAHESTKAASRIRPSQNWIGTT